MLKKILISLLLLLVVTSSLFVSNVKAADSSSTWYNQGFREWYTKVYDNNPDEIFGERYTAAQINWIIWSVVSWLPTRIVGPDIIKCAVSGDIGSCASGIFTDPVLPKGVSLNNNQSFVSELFADRSLSGITYVKNIARKFSLIPQVEAQQPGFGYEALGPINNMWRASRDIAYALAVIIVVVMAFMIMFRVKIAPQVVISVQSSIPKLAIALVLVTFSYAIAGFLVDLMYVVIGLVSLLGKSFLPFTVKASLVFNFLTLGQPLNINLQLGSTGLFFFYIIIFLVGMIIALFTYLGSSASILSGAVLAIGIGSAVTASGGSVGALLLLGGLLLIAIIAIVAMWMAIRIMWMLLKAYSGIVLLTIFAPFQILLGAVVPSMGFGAWLKSFISNLSVFVVAGTMFLLSFSFAFQAYLTIIKQYDQSIVENIARIIFGAGATTLVTGSSTQTWPPLLFFGGNSGVAILLLGVSFVIFTLIPKASDIVKSVVEGRPFAYGTALGEVAAPLRAGWGLTGAPVVDTVRRYGAEQTTYNLLSKAEKVPYLGDQARILRKRMEDHK